MQEEPFLYHLKLSEQPPPSPWWSFPIRIPKELVRVLDQLPVNANLVIPFLVVPKKKQWIRGGDKKSCGHQVRREFEAMLKLELARPGICGYLHKEFGIRHFMRYDTGLLIRQYDERDTHQPYGIIIQPDADHNGAFGYSPHVLSQLANQLQEAGYGMRILECNSRVELARLFVYLYRKYSQFHKIAFAVVGGHGTPTTIRFGDWKVSYSVLEREAEAKAEQRYYDPLDMESTRYFKLSRGRQILQKAPVSARSELLTMRDVSGRRGREATRLFEEHPTIILQSCSTGQAGGIAQEMSKLGAEVIAPEIDTNITEITAQKDPTTGRLHFTVDYLQKSVGKTYDKGESTTKY